MPSDEPKSQPAIANHRVAVTAKCGECGEAQMCIQLRCHGCMICRKCMTSLIEVIRRDCG